MHHRANVRGDRSNHCCHMAIFAIFGRPFVKQFALCYQTIVCLYVCPVCKVDVLWPNGWMDQDETWHAGRPVSYTHLTLPTILRV